MYAYHVGENRWSRLAIAAPAGKKPADFVGWNTAWAYDPKHKVTLMILGDRPGDDSRAQVFALRYLNAR
jgi:hypothetical protein